MAPFPRQKWLRERATVLHYMLLLLRSLASVKALLLANPWLGVLPNISCLFHRPLGLIYDRIMKSNGEEGKWEEEEKSTVWLQNKFSMSASSLISHLLRSFVCAGAVASTVRVLSCFSSAVTDGDPVQLFLHSREHAQPNCYNRKTSDTRWLYEIFRSLWIVLYEYTLGVRDHDIVKDSIIQSGCVSFMEAERSLPCDHNQLLSKIAWNVLRNNINNNNYYYYHY
jgi:hypothetical protein